MVYTYMIYFKKKISIDNIVTLVGYCCKKDQKAAKALLLYLGPSETKFYHSIRFSSFVATLSCKNICSINPAYVLEHHQPCIHFAASTLHTFCSINPAYVLQHQPWKMLAASTLQDVCSIHPANILFLHTCNIILAFNPTNIFVCKFASFTCPKAIIFWDVNLQCWDY